MAIRIVHGDLLKQSDVDAIVNTVNCVGVMGKGIALQFKNKWPENFQAYHAACKAGQVRIGHMFVFDNGGLLKPQFIINFPTKDHWKEASRMEYIREGLKDLVTLVRKLGIASIAIPPLGCGNGGLDWADVRPLIEDALGELPDVDVRLFSPDRTPVPKSMEVRTERPRMTPGRAAILKLLETYRELNYGLSRVEVQKLAYFLQEAGEPLNLTFAKDRFGPYSDQLRHVLNRMEGHFVSGVGDGVVDSEIEPLTDALADAERFIREQGNSRLATRVDQVRRLIDGFQSPYGIELLASVHWVACHEADIDDMSAAFAEIQKWSPRKREIMKPEHVAIAWNRLSSEGWFKTPDRQRGGSH